jgi:Fe-S-cluster-containing dehydrogenase component/CRP-like cAMP-binding protein
MGAVSRTGGGWPRALWRSEWLRGIDDVGRELIEGAGALRVFDRGARLFAPGEPADVFFVLGDGLVDVRIVRRGDAQSSVVRRAAAGDAVGEEAIVRLGAPRATEATCACRTTVAEVPVAVFRRAVERAGPTGAAKREAALRAAAARDAVRASSFGRGLPERHVDALVRAAGHRVLDRGEVLYEKGTPATHVYVVADGMISLQVEEGGRVRVRGYLARGDLVVDGGFDSGGAHDTTAAACGPAWILAIDREPVLRIARAHPDALARARRVAVAPVLPEATRHVLGDLWRFAVAGSMLVIDDEACVRCGHCAWSCAQAHDDGVSRLVRRGEKVVVRDAVDGTSRALVVPGSCQHCKHPACMLECPTGAIGRDPRGDVFVREELCVGCGACVKACPWGSVQLAPRAPAGGPRSVVRAVPDGSAPAGGGQPALVAVKCDTCRGVASGPACVSACPVDAIARVEPAAAMAEVRDALGAGVNARALPRVRPSWPFVAAAIVVAAAWARITPTSRPGHLATGTLAGVLVIALSAYAAVKRTRLRGAGARGGLSRVRPHTIAHLALGTLAAGAVGAHCGWRAPPNAAGALLVAFAMATAAGLASALAYRLLPKALSKIERRALLPEDLPLRARELEERAFAVLTGRSDATKTVYERLLLSYARAPLGPLTLIARRATLAAEERRLEQRIERVLGSAASQLDGLKDLVRLVVEQRAVSAQRVLQLALRTSVPAHVLAAAVTVVLLAVHVGLALRGR